MIDQAKKSSLQTLAAGFLGFVGVVGLGSLVILHHGGAAVKAPSVAYAPVDADPAPRAPLRLKPALAAESSPAPLLPDEAREEVPAQAPVPAPSFASPTVAAVGAAPAKSQAGPARSPKLAVSRSIDMSGSASSSASASIAAAAAPKRKGAAPFVKKPFVLPKLDLSKNPPTLASTVHYSVSDRAELMGRAAGPVYNFSGGSAGGSRGAQVAADNAAAAGAIQKVDDAQKQLDSSNIAPDEKAKLDQNLNQVRQTAAAAAPAQ